MLSGIPDELYWRLDSQELSALLRLKARQERALTRADNLRAGLVAATIANVHRKKGGRLFKPSDFLAEKRKYMTPVEARSYMDRWARAVNANQKAVAKAQAAPAKDGGK